jgi:hypothetical protein
MKVTGACHCGRIQYAADVDESSVVLCHCTDCQILTGTAFRVNAPASFESFKLTCGTSKTYEKLAESGSARVHGFCADCGTPLYSVAPGNVAADRKLTHWGCGQ